MLGIEASGELIDRSRTRQSALFYIALHFDWQIDALIRKAQR